MNAFPQDALLLLTLLFAIAEWLAVEKKWRPVEYFAKPGTMAALLAWVAAAGGVRGVMAWFALGLVLSLVGDTLLLLSPRFFIGGLCAFLLAHSAYIIGFNIYRPVYSPWALVVLLIIFLIAQGVFRRLSAGLKRHNQLPMRLPVLVYTIVISIMVISALLTLSRPAWGIAPALFVSLGAVLFYISDGLLAWEIFVNRLPHGRLLVMVTYYLGQMAIALGAVMNFTTAPF